ncbi:glutamine synthetase [Desulfobulbus propionicus]
MAPPRSQIEKALDDQIMPDGSSCENFAHISKSDMYLKSDSNTYK